MTGMVAGGVVGFSVGVARVRRWQAEHGQELLQWRRGGLRHSRHYLRPTGGRFERGEDARVRAGSAASSGG
jgi:hypothetical protein